MRRRSLSWTGDFGLATDGWIAAEPSDALDFENANKKTLRDGEERLMLAVLEDAVQCFQEYVLSTRPREKRMFEEAEEWILEKDAEYIFSFEFICETLGFHPDHIRRGPHGVEGCQTQNGRFSRGQEPASA
ncbi:MAG: hypothetical protein WCH75_05600 [Candidatus Binatia bacterium]